MQKLKKEICENLKKKLDGLNDMHGLTVSEIEEFIETPPDPAMGDFAFPCFRLSRVLRKAPAQIAKELEEGLSVRGISKVESSGPYLNFFVDSSYLPEIVDSIVSLGEKYGSADIGHGGNVVLDYSSPNVAKPFHIGHLGTTVIGHSLKKIHSFVGYNCIGVNHLGDWGTQFGKLIVACRLWGSEKEIEEGGIDKLVELYVRFHKEAESDPSLEDAARAEFAKLEQGDPDNTAMWRWFIKISIEEYKKTYRMLGIEFDSYNGESFYTDKMPAVVDELREKGLLKIDDGASIVDLSEYSLPPCLILKKDGSSLYPTRDIAAALYRNRTYAFEKCIYVTSAQQILHFQQWFKVVELMGYDFAKKLVHVPYGTVSINGTKLATRTGNVVLLRDLFSLAVEKVKSIMEAKNPDLPDRDEVAEKIGVSAIVFHYLMNTRSHDINFVLDDALDFDGNSGPYAQYTYARACSIIEKAGESGPVSGGTVTSPLESDLIKVLAEFPEKVLVALREYEPSVIVRYILDVCYSFNRMYHECRILNAENSDVRDFRVKLTRAVKTVLGNAFDLVCISKTEKI